MNKGAVISDCGNYRYSLSRVWDVQLPMLLFIMLNPSTADDKEDDRTISRCIDFAKSWGYGGFYVGNLFAYRTKEPKILKGYFKAGGDIIGPENMQHIKAMSIECRAVVFAWGTSGSLNNQDTKIVSMFPNAMCIKRTKKGFPIHPLYQDGSLKLIPFIEQ